MVVALAGWMTRQQQEAIEYLRTENRILRELLGQKRIRLNDVQKRRLATAAFGLGRSLLKSIGSLFCPDTLLRWHHWFVARKYDGSGNRKPGPEPKKQNSIRDLVLRMAADNPSWGYGHITGELKGLGIKVHWQTVRRVMLDHGLLDDPDKPPKTSWTTFLKSHWESLAACDFFTLESWGLKGLVRWYVYFVIDLASRRVEIAGITDCPTEQWVVQQARNLTDPDEGFLKDKRLLIHDRDPLFTVKFKDTLKAGGIRCLKMPKQSPNLNAVAERFVWGAKYGCLNHMILFGEKHVRYVVQSYVDHYNTERPHQGLGNRRVIEPPDPPPKEGPVRCRERLGGLLKSYYRAAA